MSGCVELNAGSYSPNLDIDGGWIPPSPRRAISTRDIKDGILVSFNFSLVVGVVSAVSKIWKCVQDLSVCSIDYSRL